MTSPDKDVAAIEARLTAIRKRAEAEYPGPSPIGAVFTQAEMRAVLADIAALLDENKRLTAKLNDPVIAETDQHITVKGEDVAAIGLHIAILKAENSDAARELQRLNDLVAEFRKREETQGRVRNLLIAERDQARNDAKQLAPQRDRYRAAWQSARRRAKAMLDDAAELNAVWALIDEWATRECIAGWVVYNVQRSKSECLHCAAAQMTYAIINADPTDPGCPHCGDLDDPDQPNLHARCRQIPDAETRRDGRDG